MRPKPPSGVGGLLEASGGKRKGPRQGLTPLMYAAQNGSAEATRLLLEARAQLSAREEDGLGPLHFAAGAACEEVCGLLLGARADVATVDEEGKRAIDYVPEGSLIMRAERDSWEALLGPLRTDSTAAFAPVAVTALPAAGTTGAEAAAAAAAAAAPDVVCTGN